MTFSEFWTYIKIRKWGKYVITLLAFLAVFLFFGDQSMIQFMKRGKEIRQLEEQRDMYREGAAKAECGNGESTAGDSGVEQLRQPGALRA